MDKIFKTYRAEVKGIDAETGEVDMFIPVSTDSVDRDGEIVEPTAFKKTLPKFMKRPVLASSHDYKTLLKQIGEWPKLRIVENGFEGKPKYYINEGNEEADWGFKLASKGMAAFSIGFIPKEWEDGDGVKSPRRTYKEVELLEISQVIVPSNREAIQNIRSKSVDPIVNAICDEVEREIKLSTVKIELTDNTPLITKPEETDEYIRIPVSEGHGEHRIRTITISDKEGIKALYCGECKKVITYLFAKDYGWTMARARAWVKEHEKSITDFMAKWLDTCFLTINDATLTLLSEAVANWFNSNPPLRKTSQAEITDEIDYLKSLIEKEGMGFEVRGLALNLASQIILTLRDFKMPDELTAYFKERISGSDIPVDIRALIKPDVSRVIETGDAFTNLDIQEAIRRIAK